MSGEGENNRDGVGVERGRVPEVRETMPRRTEDDAGDGGFADPAKGECGERDPELDRREELIDGVLELECGAGTGAAKGDELLDAGLADADDGELCCDEETVGQDEKGHHDDAEEYPLEHRCSVTSGGRGDCSLGLLVATQEDHHSDEIEQRRRQQQEPAYGRKRGYREDVTDVGEEVGEAQACCHGEPHGILTPAPERDGLAKGEGSPLTSRAAQKCSLKASGDSVVKDPEPEPRRDPGDDEQKGVLYQSAPQVNENDGFESSLNHGRPSFRHKATPVSQMHRMPLCFHGEWLRKKQRPGDSKSPGRVRSRFAYARTLSTDLSIVSLGT